MSPLSQLIYDSFWPLFTASFLFTLPLTILSFIGGLTVGFIIAMFRLYGSYIIKNIFRLYIWIIRGTPLLVQLFLIFYGLPSFGIILPAFLAAFISFSLNVSAYSSEIIRGAIISIPKTQWEAAWAVGMTSIQTMYKIILPQSILISIPALANSFISLLKDTSLAAIITVPEIFLVGQQIVSVTYEPLIIYVEVAVIYLFYSALLDVLQHFLETNLYQQKK